MSELNLKKQNYYRYGGRTYRITAKVIDEFYEWCTENMHNPTLNRFIDWVDGGYQKKN